MKLHNRSKKTLPETTLNPSWGSSKDSLGERSTGCVETSCFQHGFGGVSAEKYGVTNSPHLVAVRCNCWRGQ